MKLLYNYFISKIIIYYSIGKETRVVSHYTREEIVREPFLFISYKHDDKNDVVSDVLDYLFKQGVRFWYDTDLSIGDRWSEVAERLINSENCCGVIFFNSEASFKSNPVYLERGFAVKKMKRCRENGTPFFIFPVNIGKPSAMRIIKSILDGLPDSDKEIERDFPLKYLKEITELFDNETLYCYADPENKEGYMKSLYGTIERALPGVISKAAMEIKTLTASSPASVKISLGVRKDEEAPDVPRSLLHKDGVLEFKNNRYIVTGGVAYTVRPLRWSVFRADGDDVILLASESICTRGGGEELVRWLTGDFMATAFTDTEREMISAVRLLKVEDIDKAVSRDALVTEPTKENPEGHWWIDDIPYGSLQRVIKKDGSVSSMGYNVRTKKSGVRPVIVISKDNLLKLT